MKKIVNSHMLLLVLALMPHLCIGQSWSFITASEITSGELDAVQQQKVQNVQNSPYTKNWRIVALGDLTTMVAYDATFPLTVPDSSETFTAQPVKVEAVTTTNYNWMGELFNTCGEKVGDITLVNREGKISGHFETYNDSWELVALGGNLAILQQLDMEAFTQPECGVSEPSEQSLNPPQHNVSPRSTGPDCNVRVLVVFGTAAEVGGFDVEQMAELAISQTNQAFANSAVDQQVVLAGVEQVSFSSTTDIEDDLNSLVDDNEVQQLRDDFDADIVVYISNNGVYDAAGLAFLFPPAAFAYAIVQRDNATSTFTFAHELGHLFGCNHQQCNLTQTDACTGNFGFNHGFRYSYQICVPNFIKLPVSRSTTMHVLQSSRPRRLRFSNPDVFEGGVATGVQNTNDNARVIEDNGCTVSCFIQESPLTASITGPNFGSAGQSIMLQSNVEGGIPPYQYIWQMGTDGINYPNQVGTGPNLTYTLFFPGPSKFLFFRLKVVSSDGQEVFAFKPVLVFFALVGGGGSESQSAVLMGSYPNPAQNGTMVEFQVLEQTEIKLELLDGKGNVVAVLAEGEHEVGSYKSRVESAFLQNGVYHCRLLAKDGVQTKSIVVLK